MKKSEALRILGLSEGATDDEVKRAHRKLVIAHHPDKFALDSKEHAEAEELTKRINEARDVLINRSWTPEFDPRRDARPYANPYAHPTGQGGDVRSGDAQPGDPFAGWPFGGDPFDLGGTGGTGSGDGRRTTYVWTSWDGVHTAGDGTGSPFDGFDPFAPFRAEPQKTPAELLAEAKARLRSEALIVAAKAAVLALTALLGSPATGLFVYVMVSIINGLWKRFGSCLIMLFIPLVIFGAPLIFLISPRQGAVTGGLALAFAVAVLYDFTNLRRLVRAWQAAKKAAS